MKKEFVTYEQSLALKELGFDEPCLRTYTWNGFDFDVLTCISDNVTTMEERLNSNNDKYTCSAPLYQQAFRFFREKYGYYYPIHRITNNTNQVLYSIGPYAGDYFTYEEAENACIDKLIEIAKQQTK